MTEGSNGVDGSDMQEVLWAEIDGFPDYEVSSNGDIRRRTPGRYFNLFGRLKKPSLSPNGYLYVSLFDGDKPKRAAVHRIVCTAFKGKAPPDRPHVAHNNGVRTCNKASNLRWASPSENNFDQDLHGTRNPPRGEMQGCSKLKEDEVLQIRRRLALGERACDLSIDYGVSRQAISHIKYGRTWAHV